MKILVNEHKEEIKRNKRIALTTLIITLLCSIIVIVGVIFNIEDLYALFSTITGICLLFLLLVLAEKKEINRNFNNNNMKNKEEI